MVRGGGGVAAAAAAAVAAGGAALWISSKYRVLGAELPWSCVHQGRRTWLRAVTAARDMVGSYN